MKRVAIAAIFASVLTGSLEAKGPTVRIEIRDIARGTVSQIDEQFRLNVRTISRHGLEGHWFNASDAWQATFAQVAAVR